jgi:hypothetical protein
VGSTAPSHAANGDKLIAITATAPFPDSARPGDHGVLWTARGAEGSGELHWTLAAPGQGTAAQLALTYLCQDVDGTERVRDTWVERYRIDPDGTLQAAWFEADLHLYDAGPGRTAMRFDLDEAKAAGP